MMLYMSLCFILLIMLIKRQLLMGMEKGYIMHKG